MSLQLSESGFVELTYHDSQGQAVTVELDLFDAYAAISEIQEQARREGWSVRRGNQALVELLREQGLPQVSQKAAVEFNNAIIKLVEREKKEDAGEPWPDSPASTASTPSS